ncbi:hypothetical protein, partial [Zestomonas carbonaria]|uniref:hypothetical protein n=1 Tax=Zestomonas carbonaria TaxID=2762745 RepID=UPI001B3563E5
DDVIDEAVQGFGALHAGGVAHGDADIAAHAGVLCVIRLGFPKNKFGRMRTFLLKCCRRCRMA